MTDEKPLTQSELITVLKKLDIVTKKDLKNLTAKDDLLTLKRSLIRRMGKNKREIMSAIAKLATSTPSRKEFEQLKTKVESYHSVS